MVVGSIVEVINPTGIVLETENKYKKNSGRWLVTEIVHVFTDQLTYNMQLILVRDGLPYDPNKETIATSIFLGDN